MVCYLDLRIRQSSFNTFWIGPRFYSVFLSWCEIVQEDKNIQCNTVDHFRYKRSLIIQSSSFNILLIRVRGSIFYVAIA